ncbi:MAG: KamA family radical SAM protein [Bacteroidales bacterium]
MKNKQQEDNNKLSIRSKKIVQLILEENPRLKETFLNSSNEDEVNKAIKLWAEEELTKRPDAYNYFTEIEKGRKAFEKLTWQDVGTIRILDYVNHTNMGYVDLNVKEKNRKNTPFKMLWQAAKHETGEGRYYYFLDMLELFRQFTGKKEYKKPSTHKVMAWMDKHPSGLDKNIIQQRTKNKERIINIIIGIIDSGLIKSSTYFFSRDISQNEKETLVNEWWNQKKFQLKFAIRDPDLLNKMLDGSLSKETMDVLYEAKKKGIPFFVNPYYLSLLNIDKKTDNFADAAIRDYIIYSKELVNEFGHIIAWEKEDVVEPGKPNAAGWLLPNSNNIHRRYPEVAIFIPDSMGRACGGLCSSCQRMYDFQRGNLNFNLEKLKPNETWPEKLNRLIKYFENDTQLRDILITGGDALMSSDITLKKILASVYEMAFRKIESNKNRKNGEKYAEIVRVRLGTRLPVYLPQRITDELIEILLEFRKKASKIGIKQFVIQTHFETAMEITPEVKAAVEKIEKAGWTITNQLVFTVAASRRGHTNKLRKVLNDIGIITYYTFTVKGYMENYHNYATNARAVQEQLEEKRIGKIPKKYKELMKSYPFLADEIVKNIDYLRDLENLPFLATDRNVINLPGVGKSLTFRTIGITKRGRRILKFEYDNTRKHSPSINKSQKVVIVASKPIGEYLRQLEKMDENIADYDTIWGFSIGETESRFPIFDYPKYDFEITSKFTNCHSES